MKTPSIKTINDRLRDNLAKDHVEPYQVAMIIKGLMVNEADIDKALDRINELMRGYGVESVRDNQWGNYYLDIGLLHVNMGDSYIPTVIYDTRSGRWSVCCLGDIIDGNRKRFDI